MPKGSQEEVVINIDLEKISKMLEDALRIYKEDRCTAKENYDSMRAQLDAIREAGLPMSEEGALETAVNQALKLQMDAAKRLDMVIQTITKIFNAQMNNRTRLLIADKFSRDDKQKLTGPADLKELLTENLK